MKEGEVFMTKGEIAKQNFLTGMNCAQAVVLAFKDELNIPYGQLKKLSIGVGGGVGRQRQVCGAVLGLTMVLSYLKSNGEDKLSIYKTIQDACAEVKEKLGSIVCAELLEGKTSSINGYVPEERTKEYYQKRPCTEIVEVVANITDKYLNLLTN